MSVEGTGRPAQTHIPDANLEPWPLPEEWVLQGSPDASGAVLSKSDDSRIVRGVWQCTPGKFTWDFTCDETLWVFKGRATVVTDAGDTVDLGPGDMAFFPRGTKSTWTVHDTVRKGFRADSPTPLPF